MLVISEYSLPIVISLLLFVCLFFYLRFLDAVAETLRLKQELKTTRTEIEDCIKVLERAKDLIQEHTIETMQLIHASLPDRKEF